MQDSTQNHPVTIVIYVSPERAILAGNSRHGSVPVNVDLSDLTSEERTILAAIQTWSGGPEFYSFHNEVLVMQKGNTWDLSRGTFSLRGDHYQGCGPIEYARPLLARADAEGVHRVLAEVSYAYGEYQDLYMVALAEVKAWCALPVPQRGDHPTWTVDTTWRPSTFKWTRGLDGKRFCFPTPKDLLGEALEECRKAAKEKQDAEDKANREKREASEAQRKAERLALHEAFICARATVEQTERYRAGVLPEQELDAMAHSLAFGGYQLDKYQPLTLADLDHADTCEVSSAVTDESETQKSDATDDEHLDVSVKTPETLGSAEWAALKAVKAAFAESDGYDFEVRRHHCKCTDCGATATRSAVHAVKRWGSGYTCTEVYAVPMRTRNEA